MEKQIADIGQGETTRWRRSSPAIAVIVGPSGGDSDYGG